MNTLIHYKTVQFYFVLYSPVYLPRIKYTPRVHTSRYIVAVNIDKWRYFTSIMLAHGASLQCHYRIGNLKTFRICYSLFITNRLEILVVLRFKGLLALVGSTTGTG